MGVPVGFMASGTGLIAYCLVRGAAPYVGALLLSKGAAVQASDEGPASHIT